MKSIKWFLLLIFLFILFVPAHSFAKKSEDDVRYELEEGYINNRNDLTWDEKCRERIKAHDRIYGEFDSSTCWLVCGGVLLAIVVSAVIQSQDKDMPGTNKKLPQKKLIKCPDCSKKISSNALVCPKCGCPIKTDSKNKVI